MNELVYLYIVSVNSRIIINFDHKSKNHQIINESTMKMFVSGIMMIKKRNGYQYLYY